jgi:hypothetical protein
MTRKHYLRFIQALALAAALPACGETGEHTSESDVAEAPTDAPADRALAVSDVVSDDAVVPASDAHEADSDVPFSSGPIVPPEMPEALA